MKKKTSDAITTHTNGSSLTYDPFNPDKAMSGSAYRRMSADAMATEKSVPHINAPGKRTA